MIKPGLDEIPEDAPVNESQPGEVVNISAPKVKGGLDIKSKIGMDPEQTKNILDSMQRIVDEREGPLNQFMSGISKARAVTYGPDAYAREAARQSAEQTQTQSYMQQIAAMKAAAKAAQQRAQYMGNAPGGGGTAAPSAGAQPVGMATTGAQPSGASRYDILTEGLTDAQKVAADSYREEGDFDSIIKMVQASALKRPDTLRILDEINRLPKGSQQSAMLERQTFPEYFKPQKAITPGGTQEYSMSGAGLPGQTAPGIQTQDIRKVEYGDLPPGVVSKKGAESAMQVMPATQAAPGFGVTPARDNSDAEKERVGRDYFNALKSYYNNDTLAAIAYNMGPGKTDDWLKNGADFNKLPAETRDYIGKTHVASSLRDRQTAPGGGPSAVAGGLSPTSVEGRGLNIEAMKGSTKLFEDKVQGPMMEKAGRENVLVDQINNSLATLDKTKVGPGTEFGKTLLEMKGNIFPLSKDEQDRLANIRTLDQSAKSLTLTGIKSTLPGGTSDSDLRYLSDAMFSINDPKKFIRATLETTKASSVLNREILNYVNQPENAFRKQQAYDEFMKSGKVREILTREAPTTFADYKPKTAAGTKTPSDLQSVLKANNIAYEPDTYEYRVNSDGSVQRKKK